MEGKVAITDDLMFYPENTNNRVFWSMGPQGLKTYESHVTRYGIIVLVNMNT
jgi:hypothetical protein